MRNRTLSALSVVALLAAALAVVVPVSANDFSAGPLTQVSGSSPFAGCTADNVPGQSGTNYANSEVEPWIDVNPTNSANLIGIWQQDRWSNGGARGLVAGVSQDAGATWTTVPIPSIAKCTGGDYQRATDPWVSFGPTGTAYQLSLSFNDYDFTHALLASRSTDGGLTWSQPVEVRKDTSAAVFNDKQSITADPTDPNLVYAVWDRLEYPNQNANIKAAFHAAAYRSPIWFARSTDGGLTWEPSRKILDPGGPNGTIGNQIVVLPNGDLVNVFDLIYNTKNSHKVRGLNVAVIRSTDKGLTWSAPIIVARLQTIFISDPETGAYVRTSDIIPEIAVDSSGRLYVVWQDARFGGFTNDSIALSVSSDGGFTWSAPVKVNQTPTNLPAGNQQAFTSSVTVSADGTVGVTYYDFRNNTPDAMTLPTDYFMVHCHAGCAEAANWGGELQLTDASFDMDQTPDAGGHFVGDYAGLVSSGNQFLSFFSQSHGPDPASAFFREAGP